MDSLMSILQSSLSDCYIMYTELTSSIERVGIRGRDLLLSGGSPVCEY